MEVLGSSKMTHTHTHAHTLSLSLSLSLCKKAAMDDKGEIVYDKIPSETIITEGKANVITKWQEQGMSSTKGAVSKLFFPYIKDTMKTMIPISAEFTALVKGHSLTRSYLRRFKIIPNSTCPCRLNEEQTINLLAPELFF